MNRSQVPEQFRPAYDEVIAQGKNAGGRDVIGILACGWLRDAMNEGAVFADAEGILAAKS